jgi:hypothetical protein
MTAGLGDPGLRNPSLAHLIGRLHAIEARVRLAVERRRAADPNLEDPFRGLYLSDDAVEGILDEGAEPPLAVPGETEIETRIEEDFEASIDAVERQADGWEAVGVTMRLRRLARIFELDAIDVELLLTAMAPDVDARFERLYGYLQDDVTRRRASVGLALELAGCSTASGADRWRLSRTGRLVRAGLLVIDEQERPALTRSLRVPDRVTAHLLANDAMDPELAAVLEGTPYAAAGGSSTQLEHALQNGLWPIFLRESGLASGVVTAAASAANLGAATLAIDLVKLARAAHPEDLVPIAIREARLLGAVLVAANLDGLAPDRAREILPPIAGAACPVIFAGQGIWDPAWSAEVPLQLDAPAPGPGLRSEQWVAAFRAAGADLNGSTERLLASAAAFNLTAPQVARAARAAQLRALSAARSIETADVQSGARAQNAGGLERLARRVEPRAGWSDLVLPPDAHDQLHELAARARHRERVLGEWGIGGNANRGQGITALFAGESGTGKTLAAEVIASELGLDLYVIDLSTVIDKYIGETEKNLDRIFNEADRVNGVLLFDEADAIFGKRSEVRDARDRYANVEVAYLLQRMERFDGLAVLTTNLRANLDDAFTRRIDSIIDFAMPEDDARLALWRKHLPATVPRDDDLDLEFMARRFRLSGGNIRNICVTAAFFSAEAGRPLSMADLIRGTEREYRKLGRLTVEAEFGPYHPLLGPRAEPLRLGG